MKNFKEDIKNTVAESLKPTNEKLKLHESNLKEKGKEIIELRKDLEIRKRKNNVVLFGVQEKAKLGEELDSMVIDLIQKITGINFSEND